jgi:hypothetical protein
MAGVGCFDNGSRNSALLHLWQTDADGEVVGLTVYYRKINTPN